MLLRARAFLQPIASRTCEGSSEPVVQAEPLEAQIPSRSRPAKSEMLSEPATVNAIVFVSRSSIGLRKVTPFGWSF